MFDKAEFESLRREYIGGARERTDYLQKAGKLLQSGDPIDLKELRGEIHKFRGSGGFYGFSTLSEAAAAAEDQLLLILDGEAEQDNQALAALVERVVATLEAAAREVGL